MIDPINYDLSNPNAINFYTEFKGTFNTSSVYGIPLVVTKAGYEDVDFKDTTKPKLDTVKTGENYYIVEPTSGFTID